MNLKDKVAIVTGASEGLGKAVALKLAEKNCQVVLVARTKVNLEKVKKTITRKGGQALAIPCDVTKPTQVKKAVGQVKKKWKKVDFLICSAGIWQKMKPIDQATDREVEELTDINFKGVVNAVRFVLPLMRKKNKGQIVNISSQSGVKAKKGQSLYCGAKFAVKGFTDSLKLDLEDTQIKVSGVYPSGMNTRMFAKAGETFSAKNFMRVEDIAEVILFILTRPKNISLEEVWIEKFTRERD
ncbi:MAG TPA: SDR family oxidoreductase [Candidatus Bathyarchaeia archaeon]|nr:SDR family oxidoreductase [Candidatus Bathyarchaeia archaeon]